jgi:hypothetical protein
VQHGLVRCRRPPCARWGIQDVASTAEGAMSLVFDFSLRGRVVPGSLWCVSWRSSIGRGGCRRRVWMESSSWVVCHGSRRWRTVVVWLPVFPDVWGCGQSRWMSVVGCGGLSVWSRRAPVAGWCSCCGGAAPPAPFRLGLKVRVVVCIIFVSGDCPSSIIGVLGGLLCRSCASFAISCCPDGSVSVCINSFLF